MHSDLTKVRQVLFNLLSNAAKFTDDGTITLTVSRAVVAGQDWLAVQVTDSGIGMTPEQLSRLFQTFSQADSSTTRKFGGTGLGLAITKRLCHLLGGDIEVVSAPARGSTFTVRLPATLGLQSALPMTVASSAVSLAPDGEPTVLLIDDDASVRDVMRRLLDDEGFRVVTASDGMQGLQLARQLHPAVITLDVLMPHMDGWAVLRALKADPELADIPVIMATIINDKNFGYMLGAAEYMAKPIDRNHLAAILRKYQPENAACSVLVVEDDGITRRMLRRLLKKQGCLVTEAANGQAALTCVAAQRPTFILLDLMLPMMDGFTLIEEIHKRAAWRSIPIVVMTAKDLSAEERHWLQGSVEKVLLKGSYSREDLLSEVHRLAARGA
jgi:CheY-like chemotaxis protein/anti-sigma regulatory factor (Ser/Thr protein kinase)